MTCVQSIRDAIGEMFGNQSSILPYGIVGFLKLVFRADSAYSVAIQVTIPRYVKTELCSPWQTPQP